MKTFALALLFLISLTCFAQEDSKWAQKTYGAYTSFVASTSSFSSNVVPGFGGMAHFRYLLSGEPESGFVIQAAGLPGFGGFANFGNTGGGAALSFYAPASVDLALGSNGMNGKRFGFGTGLGLAVAYATVSDGGQAFLFGPEFNLNFRARLFRMDNFYRIGAMYSLVTKNTVGLAFSITRPIRQNDGVGRYREGGYQSDLRSTRGLNLNSWNR